MPDLVTALLLVVTVCITSLQGSGLALPYFHTERGIAVENWEKMLVQFRTDKTAAQREIERAKQVYMQKQAAGDKAGADAAHNWANQVRQAAGITNDDPMYGNNPNTYRGVGSKPSNPLTTPPPQYQMPQMPSPTAGNSQTQQMLQVLMGLMGGGGGGISSDQQRQFEQIAKQRADQQRKAYEYQLQMLQAQQNAMLGNYHLGMNQLNNDKLLSQQQFLQNMLMMNNQKTSEQSALEAMLKMAERNREMGLQSVNNSTEEAKAALENRSFQDYLESRQNISDRGLSGSGLAADADTRLMLARDGQLANIMRDAAQQQANVHNAYSGASDQVAMGQSNLERTYGTNLMQLIGNLTAQQAQFGNRAQELNMSRYNTLQQYAPQFNRITDQMGQIDESAYLEELMGNAQSSANQQNIERMRILSSLIGTMLPYERATMNDMLGRQFQYDQLNSNNQNEYLSRLLDQLQWQGDNQFRYDQLQQNGMMDWMRIFGFDPSTGQQTLDMQRMLIDQQIRQQAQYLQQLGMDYDQAYRQAQMQYNWSRLGGTMPNGTPTWDRQQGENSVLMNVANNIRSQLSSLYQALQQDPNNAGVRNRIHQLEGELNLILRQVTGTPQGGTNAPPLGYSNGGYPIVGPPVPQG